MNTNRQFDGHIKEQFSNYAPDVHPRIWENIIAVKDKKRPVGFWVSMFNTRNKLLLLGLVIALSSGGAWLYYNNNFFAKETTSENIKENNNNKQSGNKTNDYTAITSPADEQSNKVSTKVLTVVQPVPGDFITPDNIIAGNRLLLSDKSKTKTSINAPLPETDSEKEPMVKAGKFYTGLGNVLVNTTSPVLEEDEYPELGGTLLGRLTYNAEKYTEKRKTGNKQETLRFNPVVFLPDCPIEKDAAGNKKYFEVYKIPAIRPICKKEKKVQISNRASVPVCVIREYSIIL
jgi:hypothetical protein